MDRVENEVCEWSVIGMDCGSCANKVRTALDRMPGVDVLDVAPMNERVRFTLDGAQTHHQEIEKTIKQLGYGVQRSSEAKVPDARASETSLKSGWFYTPKGQLVIGTGLLLAAAWLIELSVGGDIGHWAFILACLVGLYPVARRALAMVRTGQFFTIEMLMSIAATGALFINAAEEAALVIFLFAVGELLEGVAANRAREGIKALANLVPKTALLETDEGTQQVPAADLRIGQVVIVRPGDRLPADGQIVEGHSGMDENPVTGESVPRAKGPGDEVFAGAINTDASLRVKVTKGPEDNTIARIVQLVQEAESARAPTERFIDRFSRFYMPAIIGVALLVVLVPPLAFAEDWGTWIYRGLALLLIGCPCALVISVPASIASALAAGAKHGLLMKGGAVIESAAKVTKVGFDKTGTLTHGRPEVTDIVGFDQAENDVLALAAAVEQSSSHPLAQAIVTRAQQQDVVIARSSQEQALAGKGVQAHIDGAAAFVTSPKYAAEQGVLAPDHLDAAKKLEAEGKTVVAVYREKQPLGLIALRDTPRTDAQAAIAQLKQMGISAVMLTGDNPRTAAAIADQFGIEYRAEMLPQDKLEAIQRLTQGDRVLMVGDGINDAPALKQAHVGVAMGSGTDVALETADGAILRDQVEDVPGQIRLARAAMANIKQNVTIALGLKAVFLVTTILGITGLWIAILADTGATVLVTLNALRLLGFKPERQT
ncbi:heavy metal translocating P-type ATPase [Maritalea mediterranea]|uniref:P-type Zn(2+) transporter n=1 Tax=Maritalea mediterranea TaxID=2909667 RepID=A0ABS9EA34_9HYPH|nr:heavy metal translocating P-type ATPase [Maritalea mediterranea]MCF4099746.1 cadmium-translocating P-type ATPase [Maritalea mediterranea]